MKQLRIGILGTAGIARKHWRAVHASGNAIITAVASRDLARARRFVAECQAELPFADSPTTFGSYEELLASANVDAVYLPLPTGVRAEWVVRAAAAGKHVICEKPCAVNAAALATMLAACREHRVQFMDGVMFVHHPRLAQMRAALADGDRIGELKRITSTFTFRYWENFFADNIRVHSELEPAGCLGDLGWYCIRLTLWALDWQMPTAITARILSAQGNARSPAAPPTEFSAELIFPGGVSASFYSSFLIPREQWAQFSGTKGSLRLDDFVHPQQPHTASFAVNGEVQTCAAAAAHDVLLIRNFANQIFSGQLNEDWPMQALKTQQVMDACLAAATR